MRITAEQLKRLIKEEIEKQAGNSGKHLPHEEIEKRAALKKEIKALVAAIDFRSLGRGEQELTAKEVQKQSSLFDKIAEWSALDAKQRKDYPGYFKGTKPKTPEEEFRVSLPSKESMEQLKKEFGITERKKQPRAFR
jgi:Zn-dependent metalloprotease